MTINRITNAMSVDVEDYFQVSAFEKVIAREQWDTLPCHVEKNTDRVMELFARYDVKATFFILGWVADRYPSLIKRVAAAGHEVASHGYSHKRVTQLSRDEFRDEVARTKNILEDLSGRAVIGYRAPSYSIVEQNLWALDELQQAGYQYSSSIYPIKHDLYGMPNAPRFKHTYCNGKLTEIPITTIKLFGKNFPGGGGGFFRLFPYSISKWMINRVNARDEQPGIFYFHPWEIDTEQPRQTKAGLKSRFRHYLNLSKTHARLEKLLQDFSWSTMQNVFFKQTTIS